MDEADFLRAMARRYVWDMSEADALVWADRTLRRVMDLGVLDDVFAMERVIGHDRLVGLLRTAPPGSLRPRSWWFWHYRLGLTDADDGASEISSVPYQAPFCPRVQNDVIFRRPKRHVGVLILFYTISFSVALQSQLA